MRDLNYIPDNQPLYSPTHFPACGNYIPYTMEVHSHYDGTMLPLYWEGTSIVLGIPLILTGNISDV